MEEKIATNNWKEELSKSARKYHVIGAWVAFILNPIWTVHDYLNVEEHWFELLIFRLIVSGLTLINLFICQKMNFNHNFIIMVPFLGISLQNAYMYSVMEVGNLQQHTFAYIALFIGAGMLVLWEMRFSVFVVATSILANLILFPIFSPLSLDEIVVNGGLLTASVAIFSILLIQTRYSLTKRSIISQLALEQSNKELAIQKNIAEKEQAKSEELLLNILPKETAEELKDKGSATPRKYNSASVLFTDFCGFTKISEKMTPNEVVNSLDYCFKAFDDIMEKYGLEKIKTIGDAYMCASGIPSPSETHAIDCVHAALEMQQFIQKWKAEMTAKGLDHWEIRLGIHSGELVAGVVGSKKFAYDIWGDTVNTAARMESSGEVGKVNISGATYELVKEHFKCEYRGKIPAKNKGEIDMYFVEG